MSDDQTPDRQNRRNRDPFHNIMHALNDFFHDKNDRGFLESMDHFFGMPQKSTRIPVSVHENDQEYKIIATLPGVKKESISIDVLQTQITIKINQYETFEGQNTKNNQNVKGQSMSSASRTISFDKAIDNERISASYQDGLLTVTAPKRKGRKIGIN